MRIVLLAFTALMSFFLAWFFYANRASPPKYDPVQRSVTEAIGLYSDFKRGERDAIQHLAAQIQRYPQAQSYTARYSEIGFKGDNRIIDYDRASKIVTKRSFKQSKADADACKCGDNHAVVTDKMIQAVAARQGSMSDFEKLGGVSYPYSIGRSIKESEPLPNAAGDFLSYIALPQKHEVSLRTLNTQYTSKTKNALSPRRRTLCLCSSDLSRPLD